MDYNIHHFSDASEVGYGQAFYLRVVNTSGEIHCSLIIGKSRVLPIKFVSIPRLEPTAAVLSAMTSKLVSKELQLSNVRLIFWTDNQVVLGYLNSTSKRFKTFVVNRIEVIRTLTNIEDWRYVKSNNNPADLASRGITVNKKEQSDIWFQGLRFLWSLKDQWPKPTQPPIQINHEDPEVKETKKVNVVNNKENVYINLTHNISTWTKLRKIMAWVIRFIQRLHGKSCTTSNAFEQVMTQLKK